MKRSTIGALLLLGVGMLAVFIWYLARPKVIEQGQKNTSDAQGISETFRVGGDNYLGYWFMTSPEMRKEALAQGLNIDFTDDGGAYADRLEKFSNGKYDCIVLPVNSYLQHGVGHNYPGVIVGAICESRGADGIVAFKDRLPSGTKLNALNNPGLKFVYTGESPSSFLLDLTICDFGLSDLKTANTWRKEVGSAREVYNAAQKGEGDVFVLWEPDLSRALQLPNMTYVWGSDKFSGYIVDVFVFRREVIEKEEARALKFLKTYFRVMDVYANNRDRAISEMSVSANLPKDSVAEIVKKISWFDLNENASLEFGIAQRAGDVANDGVINTIIACTNVLLRTGKFPNDPLKGNPYLITNTSLLKALLNARTTGAVGGGGVPEAIRFAPLDDEGWKRLREIGTMRVEPITFDQSSNMLNEDGKSRVDEIAGMLANNYPGYRVVIRGHTAPGGDESENTRLSLERAEVVTQRLIAVHRLDPNRVRAEGCGSSLPLPKRPNEGPREYRYRLPRVEFVLYEASGF